MYKYKNIESSNSTPETSNTLDIVALKQDNLKKKKTLIDKCNYQSSEEKL